MLPCIFQPHLTHNMTKLTHKLGQKLSTLPTVCPKKLYIFLKINFEAVHFSMTKMLTFSNYRDMHKSFDTKSVYFYVFLRLLTHVAFFRQNGLILSEVFCIRKEARISKKISHNRAKNPLS